MENMQSDTTLGYTTVTDLIGVLVEMGSDLVQRSVDADSEQAMDSNSNHNDMRLSVNTDDDLYKPPTWVVIMLSIFYGTISFLAVVGNFLVIWIVATSKRMQNVTNYFISNLALADIIIGLFSIPFQFQAALLQRWNLPEFMCPFCPFVQALSVSVSVFTLTAIAVDRHRAILYPLSIPPSKKMAKIVIGCIWLMGIILAMPMIIALRVVLNEANNQTPFCDFVNISEKSMSIYRTILLFSQYIIPLFIISFVYIRMAIKLWGTKTPGNAQDSRDATMIKNKKKVIKMLVIVVAIFAICWLPLQTYQVLQTYFDEINEYRYINIIFFCFDWLAMSNSCYNPFIYGIYNEKFRKEFKTRFPTWSQRFFNNSATINNSANSNSISQSRIVRTGDCIIRSSKIYQSNEVSQSKISSIQIQKMDSECTPLQTVGIEESISISPQIEEKVDSVVVFYGEEASMREDEPSCVVHEVPDEDNFSSEKCLRGELDDLDRDQVDGE